MLTSVLIFSLVFSLFLLLANGGLGLFNRHQRSNGWVLLSVILLIPSVALFLYLPQGLSLGGGFDLRLLSQINSLELAQTDQQRQSNLRSIESLLRPVLQQKEPADQHLQLLAETYSSLDRHADAVEVYRRLVERYPSDPMTLTLLAQAIYLSINSQTADSPDQLAHNQQQMADLLDRALSIEPAFALALSLRGMQSFQQQNYSQAIEFWTQALSQYGSNSAESVSLQQGIQLARAKLPPLTSQSEPVTAIIRLQVTLSSELASSQIPSTTPVFIFARAAGEASIPLAAKKISFGDLPAEVLLTEQDKMAASSLLDHQQVFVTARLALSGQALARPEDIESQALAVSVSHSIASAPVHILTIGR